MSRCEHRKFPRRWAAVWSVLLVPLAAPKIAHAVDCTSRPDLCGLHVESEINEPNLEIAHDIVFLGDGFTAKSLSRYRSVVTSVIAGLKALPPDGGVISHDPKLFNFHRVDVISQTENVTNQSQTDTALGSIATGRATDQIDIPASYDQRTLLDVPAHNAPSVDTIVLVVNVPGGRAWSWLANGHTTGGVIITPADDTKVASLNHELGHAIFYLFDEYGSGTGKCSPNEEVDVLPVPNVTTDPTGKKFERAGPPTPFEGALVSDRCVWRPARTCVMRDTVGTWCSVCRRHIRVQLAERRNRDDRDPPYVSWVGAAPMQPVSGKVKLDVAAWDTRRLAKVEVVVDGRKEPLPRVPPSEATKGPRYATRLAFEWDASIETNGRHELTLTAFDAAGQVDTIVRTYEVTGGDGSIARRKPAEQAASSQGMDQETTTNKKKKKKSEDDASMEASTFGCQVAGRAAAPGWLAVALVLLLLERRREQTHPHRVHG